MYRFSVWLCCLAFTGCGEAQVDVNPKPIIKPSSVLITKHLDFVEMRLGKVVSKVKVIPSPLTTIALTVDEDEKLTYAARTEHNCRARVSTIKHFAVYDDKMKLLQEADVNTELLFEPGSLGEAEFDLACFTVSSTSNS